MPVGRLDWELAEIWIWIDRLMWMSVRYWILCIVVGRVYTVYIERK